MQWLECCEGEVNGDGTPMDAGKGKSHDLRPFSSPARPMVKKGSSAAAATRFLLTSNFWYSTGQPAYLLGWYFHSLTTPARGILLSTFGFFTAE